MFLGLALYTAAAVAANAGAAELAALRQGDMRKLAIHETPVEVGTATLTDAKGGEHALADWQGKTVLLNFWATWCAPCRKEMPGLDALQREMGGEGFEVVTVATGRNTPEGVRRFFDEIGVTDLPVLFDAKMQLAREMGVLGLPVTVILDPEGREIARMMGEADWTTPEARTLLEAIAAPEG